MVMSDLDAEDALISRITMLEHQLTLVESALQNPDGAGIRRELVDALRKLNIPGGTSRDATKRQPATVVQLRHAKRALTDVLGDEFVAGDTTGGSGPIRS